MRALVVYESMFGNTARVARTVADELSRSMEVDLREVSQAPAAIHDLADMVDLIVVGGPTHAFSLSRPSTREEALGRGATQGSAEVGVREWLEALPCGPHSESLATFDTRVTKVRHLPGSAARKAERISRSHGYPRALSRESFYVADVSGPLLPGELVRAREWGRDLALRVADLAQGGQQSRAT